MQRQDRKVRGVQSQVCRTHVDVGPMCPFHNYKGRLEASTLSQRFFPCVGTEDHEGGRRIITTLWRPSQKMKALGCVPRCTQPLSFLTSWALWGEVRVGVGEHVPEGLGETSGKWSGVTGAGRTAVMLGCLPVAAALAGSSEPSPGPEPSSSHRPFL